MKKKLLLMMCAPAMLAAQNGVTVKGLNVSSGTVTFNVNWNRDAMSVALWSDTVWVFVDYNNAGKMERLPLLPGATLTATSPGGKVIEETNSNKGVWVAGNARTNSSFSATVKLLTAVKDVGGACVYGSNYPPVGEYSSDAPMLSFTGTPMYDIQLAKPGGGSVTVKSGDTFLLPCEYTVTSFTDATGALGQLNGTPFNNGSVPQYAASTRTWTVDSQVWSDVINVPECDRADFTVDNNVPYCRSYTTSGTKWYYYNWSYMNKNQDALCSGQWRVPTIEDFETLDKSLGGSGTCRSNADRNWVTAAYITTWGGTYGTGYIEHTSGISGQPSRSLLWTSSIYNDTSVYYAEYQTTGYVCPAKRDGKRFGFIVRCVK
jgi:uncharacterized protein (TIGR02145 family)